MDVNNNSNYVSAQNKQLADEYRKAFRLTDRDNVQICIFPKGKAGKKAGSFIYKPLSAKALRLKSEINRIKNKVAELENSDVPHSEKLEALNGLKIMRKYTEDKLNSEIAALPSSGYIAIEEDE